MKHGVLSDLSVPGTEIEVRVTPNAPHDDLLVECMGLRVFITDNIDSEKANESTAELLAAALGIPSAHMHLTAGENSQDKVFVVDE
ncbi:DUF167 domain-containing protein [Aliiruegeria sabulilitoris]|uniref:DUF167 domain-containing protein n=1 Tax=Aliiruegeria sabulilitoris TaxID=1510458 RepID=UPI00082C50C4|nr:DUF167 domain-containing protein [Aliiruegeria sabulilitoris]NDR56766.1 DUF167 domain-containing protein [Pseudoruegeria sp. M32A2M]